MYRLLWAVFWGLLTALLVYAGLRLRVQIHRRLGAPEPRVDDQAVRSILETGRLRTMEDEPLDMDEIHEQEERFWSESWDEPDEW